MSVCQYVLNWLQNYERRNDTFTKEDKSLIKNLFEFKGYNAKHLVREFPRKR